MNRGFWWGVFWTLAVWFSAENWPLVGGLLHAGLSAVADGSAAFADAAR